MQIRGRYVARCHLVRLQPYPHGESAVAKNVSPLHTADRAQLGLHHARQIVSNLVLIKIGGREADVHRGKLSVGGFQFDDGSFRLRRQIIANLSHFCLDLSERRVGVIVELQVHTNGAQPLCTRRLHVVDSVGACDHSLQRRSYESANQVGVRAYIHRRDRDHRDVAARILAHT